MLKIIGTAVVCLVCTVGGLYLSAKIKKTQQCRNELRRLIERIGTDISFGALPLSQIYERFEAPTLSRIGFSGALRKEGFAAALPVVLPYLDAQSAAVLTDFAASVGKSTFAASETALCTRTLAALDAIDQACSPKEDTRAALLSRLGLIAAVTAALALL